MEGESLVLFFILSGGALVLLFLVVLWQRTRIIQLDGKLSDASRNLARQNDTSTGSFIPLLDEAPFPACYATTQGNIVAASKPFLHLAGKKVATLNDFTQATGCQLAAAHTKHRHERIVIQSEGGLRHFSLVTWPVESKNSHVGTVYSLLEHTSTVRHSQEQFSFGQEMLTLQAELLKNLQKDSGNTALLAEMQNLTEFIQQQSTPHPHRTFEHFDVVDCTQEALNTYRAHFRSRNVSVMATLPKRVIAQGYAGESTEVVKLLLAAVAEHAPAHSTVRLALGRRGKYVDLSITLPDLRGRGSLQELFAFGSKAIKRQSQVRLALARLLLGHQHGSLSLMVDDEGAAVARISFVAAQE
jgi:hypothetical protein